MAVKLFFIPRDKTFWWYNCIPLVIIWCMALVTTLLWSQTVALNIVANTSFLPLLTLSGLVFRWFYKTRSGHALSIVKLIPLIVLYATVFGLLQALFFQILIVTPFFWQDLLAEHLKSNPAATAQSLRLQMVIGLGLQMQLFIGLWAFSYIGIVNNRRAKESELTNLRLQNSLKEAQLANLVNQLNPHFLFNAINNIRFTIYEDATKADAMLTGLAEMLRYSLERSKQDKVRLSEELEIIALYIDLIKVQMEERLVFSLKVAENLHNYLIPPMTLQLLVENAVKHGIDKLRHGGVIELKAESKAQQLVFKVSNNRGENKPLLSSEAAPNNIGIGLVNIQERLRLLYGERASLQIEKTSDNFAVTLTLPRESGI